ncbi:MULTISPECIES: helix-turn-helix transcriptional regulator [Burkholderia]|nr:MULTISPECIES: LuxR C-terminal-related transcriptional regulator [Burkholderia]MCA7905390.1 LuxR C-terminal-related transcriptional regulator [Burkholderia contaminans]MCA8186099.1 LuxR C-terminal-related transcriptional regulator [Burkholderia contaminans]MCA8367927.1 LuxR C-terminal-related transcriptional regulator [Burkholderia contaminans]MCQ4558555.1 LuxR C-terminal-related transcriptional regulator [Burkholderia contaminans]MDE4935180.1 LuxR C-terminal-related transcriptional regulato
MSSDPDAEKVRTVCRRRAERSPCAVPASTAGDVASVPAIRYRRVRIRVFKSCRHSCAQAQLQRLIRNPFMEFSRLFAHVGEAISSSGSRRFPRMMYNLIAAAVPVDEIRISELAVDDAPDGHPEVRSLGAVGAALAKAGAAAVRCGPQMPPRAGASPLHVDDTLAGHGPIHAQLDRFILMQAAIVSPRYAQFHLVTRKRGHCYVISLYRTCTFDDFSPQERTFLKELSHVLFPIVESHVAALDSAPPSARVTAAAPPATQSGRERVARRFADRLEQAGVKLSTREIEACTALLAGDTVPAIAMRFALRESTVETYLKRAAVKLGFSGRHGLTRWMLDETAGAATEAGGGEMRTVRRDYVAPRIGT